MQAGIPAVALSTPLFETGVQGGYQGQGLSDLPVVSIGRGHLPSGKEALKPAVEEALDRIIHGLTEWKPKPAKKKIEPLGKFVFEGVNYQEAVDKFHGFFLMNRWGDGLPLTPPTEERVKWLLTGAGRSPCEVLGRIGPRFGDVSIEVIAVNAAMAGARPEYMPVIITALEAMLKPEFELTSSLTTTNPTALVIIVNGPIAEEIGVNSSDFGLLGPDPKHPAGAAIGRAVRFTLQHVGGLIPGVNAMSQFAQPGRYGPGLVFAEAEDKLPPGWKPLSEEQGYAPGSNTVSVFSEANIVNASGVDNEIVNESGVNEGVTLEGSLRRVASAMKVPNWLLYHTEKMDVERDAGILILRPDLAQKIVKAGWSKKDLQNYLYRNARIPHEDFDLLRWYARRVPWVKPFDDAGGAVPIGRSPEAFKIVVAGAPGNHAPFLMGGTGGVRLVTQPVKKLPAQWQELLKKGLREGELRTIDAYAEFGISVNPSHNN